MIRSVIVSLLGLLMLGGCSSPGAVAPVEVTSKASPVESRCVAVPAATVTAIASGARPQYKPLRLTHAAAVHVDAFYLVAAVIGDDDGSPTVGTWATTDLANLGSTGSVGAVAEQFTVWPTVLGGIDLTNLIAMDEYSEVKACAER